MYVREAEAAFILAIDSGLGRLLCELDRKGLPEALGSGPWLRSPRDFKSTSVLK